MSYWVYNANIDGFRCDYADYVPDNFWTEAISSLRKIKKQPILMLAEGTKVTHFASGFDYTFGFNFFGAMEKVFGEGKSAKSLEDSNAIEYANNYSDSQRVVRYTSNHDVNVSEGTPLALFGGKKGSVAAFVVAAYLKSVPMIYNGQEIGYDKKIEFFTRTPINWARADASMLAEYKKIIAFRKTSTAIKKGSYTGFSSTAVSVFTMESAGEKVLVLSNLTNAAVSYSVPTSLVNTAWKNAFSGEGVAVGTVVSLKPYEYIVLKN
jgi:glycosidase